MRTIIVILLLLLLACNCFAGQATLTWDPPTTNEDGTPLTDLAGYKVYYRISSSEEYTNIDIGMGTCMKDVDCIYIVTGLNSHVRYFFVMTAYNTSAFESGYSNTANKLIDPGATTGTSAPNILIGSGAANITLQ